MKGKKFGSVMGGQKTRISHLLLYLFLRIFLHGVHGS